MLVLAEITTIIIVATSDNDDLEPGFYRHNNPRVFNGVRDTDVNSNGMFETKVPVDTGREVRHFPAVCKVLYVFDRRG